MGEQLTRRQRLRRRIFWNGDHWSDEVLDWLERQPEGWRSSDRLYEFLTPHDREGWAAKWICRLMFAHWAIEDHCGKPEHDACLFCGLGIPDGAAAERAARFERIAERQAARYSLDEVQRLLDIPDDAPTESVDPLEPRETP